MVDLSRLFFWGLNLILAHIIERSLAIGTSSGVVGMVKLHADELYYCYYSLAQAFPVLPFRIQALKKNHCYFEAL